MSIRNSKSRAFIQSRHGIVSSVRPRALMFVFTVLLVTIIFASRSSAIFENDVIYPTGAKAFSLGGSAVPSSRDTLSFLRNPASVTDIGSKNYIFSRGSFSTEVNGSYSFMLLSMTQKGKGAITLSKSDSRAASQRRLMYSYGTRDSKQRLAYGFNVSTFQMKKTVTSFTGVTTNSDANGFLFDIGFLYQLNVKTKLGFAIINFIPSVGSEKDTSISGNLNVIPRNMNIGMKYALRDNVNMNLSLQRFSYNNKDLRSYNNITVGFEYLIPDKTTLNFSVNKLGNSLGNGETDKYLATGVAYRTESIDAAVAGSFKNEILGSGNIMTFSYKPSGEWEAPVLAAPVKAATATANTTATKTTFVKPLPVLSEPVIPDTTVNISEFPVDRDNETVITPVTPVKKTRPIAIEDASVDPGVIIVPFGDVPEFSGLDGHWAEKYVLNLSDSGFFPAASGAFMPDKLVDRSEFYRLLLILQLSRSYSRPIIALFSTDEPVRAAATLGGPSLDSPILLLKGSYEKSGKKRIIIGRDLLHERNVLAGRYKLHVHLTADDEGEGDFEEPVTILDTSINLPAQEELQGPDGDNKYDDIKNRLSALGLSPDYIKSAGVTGSVTRIEALDSLLSALGVAIPSGHERDVRFSDIGSLTAEQKNSLFLSSLPLPSLDNKALMTGYPDGSFRPEKPITSGESAALIERAGRIDARDLRISSASKSSVSSAPFITNTTKPAATKPVNSSVSNGKMTTVRQPDTEIKSFSAPSVKAVIRIMEPGRESVWSAVSSEQPDPQPRRADKDLETAHPQPAPVYQDAIPLQRNAPNTRYLVVAKKSIQEQSARNAIFELERLGFAATTFVEKSGNDLNYFVILGTYQSEGDASLHAQTPIPNFKLSVKKVELDSEGLKSLPLSARNPKPRKNLNEREVILNLPSDDSPGSATTPGSYLMQQ